MSLRHDIAIAWMTGECSMFEAMNAFDMRNDPTITARSPFPQDVARIDERCLVELGEDLYMLAIEHHARER